MSRLSAKKSDGVILFHSWIGDVGQVMRGEGRPYRQCTAQ